MQITLFQQVKQYIIRNPFIIGIGIVCLILGYFYISDMPVSQPPGILVEVAPVQVNLPGNTAFLHEGYWLTPLAEFNIDARVLGKKRYRFDRTAGISPIDLALGWGPMSDTSVLDNFSFQQRRRWVFYRYKRAPLSASEINLHMSNMHMIPANSKIARQLKNVREGEIVSITGKLVFVEGSNGLKWRSSMSRTDTGDGACEIIFVEQIEIR